MGQDEGKQVLNYPIPSGTALGPPAEWAQLREACPMARVTLPSGDEASLLTRYEDVKEVLSDSRFTRLLNADDAARLSGWPRSSASAAALAMVEARRAKGYPGRLIPVSA